MKCSRVTVILAVCSAFICLIVAALLDRYFLEYTVVYDGKIESLYLRAMLLIGQVMFLGLATWFYIQREKELTVKWSLAAITTLCSLIIGLGSLELFLEEPAGVSGWKSVRPESERNQLGFRGQSIQYSSEDFVIVLLGDSQVAALACAHDWMPERRLQHHLNSKGKGVKVFSVGALGYGQDQQLMALREYFVKFRADLVVEWLTPGNDITDIMWPTHWGEQSIYSKPTFRLMNDELVEPTGQIGQRIVLSRSTLLSRTLQLGMGDRNLEWEQYLPAPYEPFAQYEGPVSKRTYPYGASRTLTKDALEHDQSFMNLYLTPPSLRIMYALNLMRRLFAEMDKIVSRNKGRLILFTAEPVGDKILDGDEVIEVAGKYFKLSAEQRERNIEYITSGYRHYHSSVYLENWAVGPMDGHLNQHAVDEAMADLADKLDPIVQKLGTSS